MIITMILIKPLSCIAFLAVLFTPSFTKGGIIPSLFSTSPKSDNNNYNIPNTKWDIETLASLPIDVLENIFLHMSGKDLGNLYLRSNQGTKLRNLLEPLTSRFRRHFYREIERHPFLELDIYKEFLDNASSSSNSSINADWTCLYATLKDFNDWKYTPPFQFGPKFLNDLHRIKQNYLIGFDISFLSNDTRDVNEEGDSSTTNNNNNDNLSLLGMIRSFFGAIYYVDNTDTSILDMFTQVMTISFGPFDGGLMVEESTGDVIVRFFTIGQITNRYTVAKSVRLHFSPGERKTIWVYIDSEQMYSKLFFEDKVTKSGSGKVIEGKRMDRVGTLTRLTGAMDEYRLPSRIEVGTKKRSRVKVDNVRIRFLRDDPEDAEVEEEAEENGGNENDNDDDHDHDRPEDWSPYIISDSRGPNGIKLNIDEEILMRNVRRFCNR